MNKPILEINADGIKEWTLNGKYHREDGPAIERPSGYKAWCINGKLHREGGGPSVEYPNGAKLWHFNGKRHRLDGPAVKSPDGAKLWYIDGNLIYSNEFLLEYYHE